MSSKTSLKLNIIQNHIDFKLEAIEDSPNIFKYQLFEKTLDPPKEDPTSLDHYRTVTIKCLYKYCR